MATNSIRVDNAVKDEASRIASELGLTFNGVVNILLRKFNAEQGFPFPVKLDSEVTVFDMSDDDFLSACRTAVEEREAVPTMDYTARLDPETGKLMKVYLDGRVEYVLD